MTESTDIECDDCGVKLVRETSETAVGLTGDDEVLVCPGSCLEIKREVEQDE